MTTSRQAPPPGLSVGGYLLRARLGEGGMGVVHLGQRPGERPVALKVLRPHIVGGDEARERLAREVKSLSLVRSPWIAEIVDADPWGDIPYVATRYVPGLSLDDHVRAEGPVAGKDLLWLARCLAEAVAAVHMVGVLHRDIKPSNVVMEGRTPILIDFGLARLADDPRLTMTGWLLGTPGYLAPEILEGEDATTASDVHAWAATLAYAGLGRPPYGRGPSMAIMDRVRRGDHDLTGLDRELLPIVEQALSPEPHRRPSLDGVRAWLAEEPDNLPSPDRMPEHADEAWTAPITVRPPETDTTRLVTTPLVDGWSAPVDSAPEPAGPGERLRRTTLALACAGVVAGGVTLAPYLTLMVTALLVWLLRSGSLAASALDVRRARRGVRWHDSPRALLSMPWHLVAAIPGALVLVLWSLGIGLSTALICFAASLPMVASLALIGGAFALSLWWGPGGARLRWPVRRVIDPVAGRGVAWLLTTVLVAALGTGLAAAASATGTDWTPDDSAPFAGLHLPSWL